MDTPFDPTKLHKMLKDKFTADLERKIAALEARVAKLEAAPLRVVYFPYQPYPQYPNGSPFVSTGGKLPTGYVRLSEFVLPPSKPEDTCTVSQPPDPNLHLS